MFKHAILRGVAVIIVLFIATSANFAQGKHGNIGKFLKSSDADILFGKVVSSLTINRDDLEEAVKNAKDYIMFCIKNNKVLITNEIKKKLIRNSEDATDKDVMLFYSKRILSSFLSFASDCDFKLELRNNNIYSISPVRGTLNGKAISSLNSVKSNIRNITSETSDIVLEMGMACPPWCVGD